MTFTFVTNNSAVNKTTLTEVTNTIAGNKTTFTLVTKHLRQTLKGLFFCIFEKTFINEY